MHPLATMNCIKKNCPLPPEVARVPVDKTKFAAGANLEGTGSDVVGLENTAESVSKQWGLQSNLEVMLSP